MNLRIQERIPLSKLDLIDEMPSPIKRKVKIYARKLPEDFFLMRNSTPMKRNDVQTQAYSRKIPVLERLSQTRDLNMRVGSLTARVREDEDKTMDLLRGVITTSRQMKKIIRKHSLQMKKQNQYQNQYNIIDNYRIELPPLMLKKGVQSVF